MIAFALVGAQAGGHHDRRHVLLLDLGRGQADALGLQQAGQGSDREAGARLVPRSIESHDQPVPEGL